MPTIHIKRVYDEPAESDGARILIDRLWPRGLTKERASLDIWLKEIAPSRELREWFGHKPERFTEFRHRYEQELAGNPAVETLRQFLRKHENVTLLYGAKDPENNHAVVLQAFLARKK